MRFARLSLSPPLALSADSSAPELGLGFQTKASNENSWILLFFIIIKPLEILLTDLITQVFQEVLFIYLKYEVLIIQVFQELLKKYYHI
jgi:hypothetical protein